MATKQSAGNGKVTEVNNTIDFKLNRKDVINIFIQEELNRLELDEKTKLREIDNIKLAIEKKADEKRTAILADKKAFIDTIRAKLPAELQALDLTCQIEREQEYSSLVLFFNDDITVTFKRVNTKYDPSANINLIQQDKEELEKQLGKLRHERDLIQTEINEVKNSGKKVEAEMIKSMLQNTTDGQQLLGLISKNKTLQLT